MSQRHYSPHSAGGWGLVTKVLPLKYSLQSSNFLLAFPDHYVLQNKTASAVQEPGKWCSSMLRHVSSFLVSKIFYKILKLSLCC